MTLHSRPRAADATETILATHGGSMLILKNPPKRVAVRARCMLTQYRQGLIKPRRTCRKGFLSLCVTREWRLLSKDEGVSWHLLSHADYDKQL